MYTKTQIVIIDLPNLWIYDIVLKNFQDHLYSNKSSYRLQMDANIFFYIALNHIHKKILRYFLHD